MSAGFSHNRNASLAARAAAAEGRGDARLQAAIDDLFTPDEARLDDRTRAAAHGVLASATHAIEADIRQHAARLLTAQGDVAAAERLLRRNDVLPALIHAGVLRDRELMDELIGRVGLDLLADALPAPVEAAESPGLLVRLARSADGVVANAAAALLVAEGRRRSATTRTAAAAAVEAGAVLSDLPAELHARLLWLVAAAIRRQVAGAPGLPERDRAIAEAAARSLAAHDEGARPEAAAKRLAIAIDARADELGGLLVAAVDDRRLTLATALLERATGVEAEQVRRLVVDPCPDLLLLLLHAAGIDRTSMARIGVALAEADGRRDLETLADAVDWAVGHDRDEARAALAPLALGRDFRAAVRALERDR